MVWPPASDYSEPASCLYRLGLRFRLLLLGLYVSSGKLYDEVVSFTIHHRPHVMKRTGCHLQLTVNCLGDLSLYTPVMSLLLYTGGVNEKPMLGTFPCIDPTLTRKPGLELLPVYTRHVNVCRCSTLYT